MIDLSTYGFNHIQSMGYACYITDRYKNKNYDLAVKSSTNTFDVYKDKMPLIIDEPLINIVPMIAKISKEIEKQ